MPSGCPVPADGPWTALRLPPGAVGSRLPGFPGVAPRGRQCQLRDLSLPSRGLLPPGAARALLRLRLRARLDRAALRGARDDARGIRADARGPGGAGVPESLLRGQERRQELRPRVQQPRLRLGRRRLLAERERPLAAVRGAAVLAPVQQQPLRPRLQFARLPLRQLRLPRRRPRAHLQVSPPSVWVSSVHTPHLTTRGPCFSVCPSVCLDLSVRPQSVRWAVPSFAPSVSWCTCLPVRVPFVCLCPSPSHPRAVYVCLPVFPFLCPVCASLFPAYQCGSPFVHPLALSVFLSASALHLPLFIPCLLVILPIHEFILPLYTPSCLSAPLLVHPRISSVHLSVYASLSLYVPHLSICTPLCPTCSFTCPFCP